MGASPAGRLAPAADWPWPLREPPWPGPGDRPARPGRSRAPGLRPARRRPRRRGGRGYLIGLLRPLVTTVLAAGDLCLCTTRAGGGRPGTGRMTAPLILTVARPGYGKAVLAYRVNVCPGQPWVVRCSLLACQVPGGCYGIPWAGSALAVRSLASLSSCVSKRVKAPGLVAAGLTAALVCELGCPKMPISSSWPDIW
jgi:hypothetical protein